MVHFTPELVSTLSNLSTLVARIAEYYGHRSDSYSFRVYLNEDSGINSLCIMIDNPKTDSPNVWPFKKNGINQPFYHVISPFNIESIRIIENYLAEAFFHVLK